MTIYYTFTGTPIAGSRGVSSLMRTEYGLIQTAFTTVNAEMILKAPLAGPTFTGTVVLPSTTSIGAVSSTEIGYLDGVTSALQAQIDNKAPLASPALTGVPTAPTAALGTNTDQIATMAALLAQTFAAALPGQPGGTIPYQLTSTASVAGWTPVSAGAMLYLANNFGGL